MICRRDCWRTSRKSRASTSPSSRPACWSREPSRASRRILLSAARLGCKAHRRCLSMHIAWNASAAPSRSVPSYVNTAPLNSGRPRADARGSVAGTEPQPSGSGQHADRRAAESREVVRFAGGDQVAVHHNLGVFPDRAGVDHIVPDGGEGCRLAALEHPGRA